MVFFKKNWMQVLTLALCAVLLAVVWKQGEQLQQMESRLRHVNQTVNYLQENLLDISRSVTDAVEAANKQVQDYTLTPTGLDTGTHSLLADISVTLKAWRADTQAVLLLTAGEETTQVPLTQTGDGVFTAPVAMPVEEDGELTLTLLADSGGTVVREDVARYAGLSDLLPIADGARSTSWETFQAGNLELHSYGFLPYDKDYNEAAVKDPVFRVYRNEALALEIPAKKGPYEGAYEEGSWYFGDPEGNAPIPVPCAVGDEVRIVFACADPYGLGYEFTIQRDLVTDGGVEEVYLDEDMYPTLFWPE